MEIQEVNFFEWSKRAYQCACNHGFHDKTFSDEHWMMMTIGEVSEMVEAHRKGRFADVEAFKKSDTVNDGEFKDKFNRFVKDTVEDEMADIIIWLADYAGMKGYEIKADELYILRLCDAMNGRVKIEGSISELGFRITKMLSSGTTDKSEDKILISTVIQFLYSIAAEMNIDLSWHVEQKMRYNELRPMLNEKRY